MPNLYYLLKAYYFKNLDFRSEIAKTPLYSSMFLHLHKYNIENINVLTVTEHRI